MKPDASTTTASTATASAIAAAVAASNPSAALVGPNGEIRQASGSVRSSGSVRRRRAKNVSRVYADANDKKPKSWWDYEHSPLMSFGKQSDYEIVRRLGRGKYSEVFEGVAIQLGKPCTIKVLKPVKQKKILREIKVLQDLRGAPNVVQLLDVVCEPATQTPCLVQEYVDNVDFRELYPTLSDYDVRFYMFQLLRALDFCHMNGIMHRDVKPHNVMIDPVRRQLKLIDWGLAEFYHAGMQYNVRVASRYFKGPELLVDIQDYDYSLDLWSFGCVLAALIFRREPFFRGKDNADQLVKIVHVLGSDGFFAFVNKYGGAVDSRLVQALQNCKRRSWQSFITPACQSRCTPDALALLDGLLVYDMPGRLTAREAMDMPYFDLVRSEASGVSQPSSSSSSSSSTSSVAQPSKDSGVESAIANTPSA